MKNQRTYRIGRARYRAQNVTRTCLGAGVVTLRNIRPNPTTAPAFMVVHAGMLPFLTLPSGER